MDLAKALISAASALSSIKGGPDKIWLLCQDQQSELVAPRGDATIRIRCPGVLPEGAFAISADDIRKRKTPLRQLEGAVLTLNARELVVGSVAGEVRFRRLPGRDIPGPADLRSATWRELGGAHVVLAGRVAALAAGPDADRPGLSWVQLGPHWIASTDEVVISWAPGGLPWRAVMPADLCGLLEPKSADVGDLGNGDIAIVQGDLLIQTHGAGSLWFPRLPEYWRQAPRGLWSAELGRAELKAAMGAASRAQPSPVVQLQLEGSRLTVGSGAVSRHVEVLAAEQARAQVCVQAQTLGRVLASGTKRVVLRFGGQLDPLTIQDADFRALVWPAQKEEGNA